MLQSMTMLLIYFIMLKSCAAGSIAIPNARIVIDRSAEWRSRIKRMFVKAAKPQLMLSEIMNLGESYLSVADQDHAWDMIADEKEVQVYKLRTGQVKFAEQDDYRWPCVKATTILHCDAKKAMDLLLDSSQTQQYNHYSIGRTDVETLSPRTKYVWNRAQIPFSIKPFDYCTLMHYYERVPTLPKKEHKNHLFCFADNHHHRQQRSKSPNTHGTTTGSSTVPSVHKENEAKKDLVLLSRHVEHPLVPLHKDFSRCENIIGLQVLHPLKNTDQGKPRTLITSISHVRYPSTHPLLISKNLKRGTLNYLQRFRDFCEKAKEQA